MENEIMNVKNSNANITISNDVITTIVTTAAKEVEGVIGIQNSLETNFSKIFNKKKVMNGVEANVSEDGKSIDINCDICVEFGYELTPIGLKVQEKIKDAIETMTSYNVSKVNVKVANVKEVSKEK